MAITNKIISKTFLKIIIRINHGQTDIVMQYGGLRSSVTCVTTSFSNDSFASPTHRTIQSLDKGLWGLFHTCTSASHSSCSNSGGFWRWRTRLRSSSHKCSIGDRSGDNADQGRTRMWWFRCCIQCCLKKFELSATIMTISAQTITPPPPKRSDSYTHWSVKRFPRLRYIR